MPLSLEQKKAVVTQVQEVASNAYSAVTAEFRGLTVANMTELRAKARTSGVYLRVVRNTLARRAVQDTEFACLSEHLSGPLVLAFSKQEPGAAARVMSDFAKQNHKLVIRSVVVAGQVMDASHIGRLASLPTKDEAISQLMSVMKVPIGKLAQTLNEIPSKLVRTIAAIRDQKQ